MFKDEIINKMTGLKLRNIIRVGCTCCVNFDVENDEKNLYKLHVQCPWRIYDSDTCKLLVASHSVFEPNSYTEWTPEFDWDVKGNNLFDEVTERMNKYNDTYVEEVFITELQDLKFKFSNGYTFELFVETTGNSESWRFFKSGDEKHWVVYGNDPASLE